MPRKIKTKILKRNCDTSINEMNQKKSKKLITQKKFSLGECAVDKRGWFKFIGGSTMRRLKLLLTDTFQED